MCLPPPLGPQLVRVSVQHLFHSRSMQTWCAHTLTFDFLNAAELIGTALFYKLFFSIIIFSCSFLSINLVFF